jgi:hypothetical protein
MDYRDLTNEIRTLMVAEINRDIDNEALYYSSYFTANGIQLWPNMIISAAQSGTDESLANEIRSANCLKIQHQRVNGVWAKVPFNAHETIAESNYSRFYLRAVCLHAQNIGDKLVGYRAKHVERPRAGSEEKIGMEFIALDILTDLRATMAGSPSLGMPPGVGSGILACIIR